MEVPAKFRSVLANLRYWLLTIVLVTVSFSLLACDGTSTTIIIGPKSVTITADTTTTKPNENITIIATVLNDSGLPIEGTTVEFAITENNSGGSIDAPSALTDSGGQASIIYTAGSTGEMEDTITATTVINSAVTDSIVITVRPTSISSLSVISGSSTLIANGINFTYIRATVINTQGQPATGESVAFTTTLGTIDSVGITDGNGVAEVRLTTGTAVGTALINASIGGLNAQTSVIFTTEPDSITVITSPSTIGPQGTSSVTATVLDAIGNPVSNVNLNFAIIQNDSGGSLPTLTATTNVNGQASVNYTAGPNVGVDTIQARLSSNSAITGEGTIEVDVGSVIIGSITLDTSTDTLVANGPTSFATLRANVSDIGGSPVAGVTVTFSTTLGTLSALTGTTNSEGVLEITLTAGPTTGTATVNATTAGFYSQVSIAIVAGAPDSLTLNASPSTINQLGTSTLTATITDDSGNPVAGEQVIFTVVTNASGGSLAGTVATSDQNGQATATYTAGSTVGNDTVSASLASNSGINNNAVITVQSTGQVVGTVSLTSGSSTLIANGTSTTTLFVQVLDLLNLTIPNIQVSFITTSGTLLATTDITDSNGVASVDFRSPTNLGTATLRAIAQGVTSNDLSIQFIAGPPNTITGTATPGSLEANGITQSNISVQVLDANNNPVAGEVLSLSADVGTLDNLIVTTDSNGRAVAVYTSPTSVPSSQQANITVQTTNGLTHTIPISLIGPQVSTITLNAVPPSIPADGTSSTTITATVAVSGGGTAPDNTQVDFQIVAGDFTASLSPLSASTTNGLALTNLTSTINPGTTTVRATAGGVTNQIDVDFTPGNVTVVSIPNSLLGTGSEISTVTVTLENADGSAPPAGEIVNFTLSDNSLGSIPASGVSDINGEVQVDFSAGQKGGTVTIFAEWTARSITGQDDITILAPPAFLTIPEGSPDPTSITVKGTGGISTSRVTFEVRDLQGNLVGDGYKINFEIANGPNGGEQIQPISATTVNGTVTTILRSGFKSGPVSIRAIYSNDTTISTTISNITISAGPPVGEEFGMFAQYRNISGLDYAGLPNDMSITIGDTYGNPIPDNTAISFKTYNMGGLIETQNVLTANGFATTTLYSTARPTPMQGFTFITAEANGARSTHITSLAVTDGVGSNETIYAGTNGGGIYKSIDSGATWVNVSRSSAGSKYGQNIIDPYVQGSSGIAIDPDNPDTVYVGTGYLGSGNIYLSRDGGANWNSNHTEDWNGIFSNNAAVLSVVADDNNSDYVWAGTEGNGAVFSSDGKHFGWGGIITDPELIGSGDGMMTSPIPTYIDETWTVTYNGATWDVSGDPIVSGGSGPQTAQATTGVPYSSDENLVNFLIIAGATPFAVGDEFTFDVFPIGFSSDPLPNPGNIGDGILSGNLTGLYRTETWFVTYNGFDWDVFGFISGLQTAQASTGVPYSSDENIVSFTITAGATPFANGDYFQFSVDSNGFTNPVPPALILSAATDETWTVTYNGATWDVVGSVSGPQAGSASFAVPYTSDNGEVSFTVTDNVPVTVFGDEFTFATDSFGNSTIPVLVSTNPLSATLTVTAVGSGADGTMSVPATLPPLAAPLLFPVQELPVLSATSKTESWLVVYDGFMGRWDVIGTRSGTQTLRAYSNIPYTSDSGEVSFTIYTNPFDPFTDGDYFTFDVTESGLGLGKIVRHIVKGRGTNQDTTCLYAATSNGIYKSTNGGLLWNEVTSFTGDNITALRLHPDIPAGASTCNNDILYAGTEDAGVWISTDSGATWLPPDIDGLGAGVGATIPAPEPSNVGNGTIDRVDVMADAISESWMLTALNATTFSVEGTLTPGPLPDATVDTPYTIANVLTFTINSGSTDFVAGDTFTFNTTRDPGLGIRDIWIDAANDQLYAATYFDGAQEPHPVGNVYSHAIEDATGDFAAAADWVYANDGLPEYDPPDDTSLFPQYVFAADDPVSPTQLYIGGAGINFYKALSGLGSGAPAWKPSKNGLTNLIMARMPILFTDLVTLDVYVNRYSSFNGEIFISNAEFKFYVEDPLGNPPISGSTMTVKVCPATATDCGNVVFFKEYGEVYTSEGTFRDPSDPLTNRPFGISLGDLAGQKVIFNFTPTCTLPNSPGCSGAVQEKVYTF